MQMVDFPAPPLPGCRAAPVRGVRAGQAFEGTDWVAEEVPVAF